MKSRRLWSCLGLFSLLAVLAGCGKSSSSPPTTGPGDTTSPSDVTGLTATSQLGGVTLTWTAATDDQGISGYKVTLVSPVFAGSREVDVSRIVDASVLEYTFTGLTEGTTYTFSVVAYDLASNASPNAATVTGSPLEPDTTPPTDATSLTGAGGWNDQTTQSYVLINLSWVPSASSDVSHYLLCVSSSSTSSSCDVLGPFNVGNVTALTIPDASGPVTSSDLLQDLAIDTSYFVRVIAVDTSGNQSSPGVQAIVTTTQSADVTPPAAVRNLAAEPRSQAVYLSWDEPLPPGDASRYAVYWRIPPESESVEWTLFDTTTQLESTVTGLTNGLEYEFMVAGLDNFGNETQGGDTAATGDDDAEKIRGIPTSDLIDSMPSVRGGVFREEHFNGRDVVLLVSTTAAGILTSDSSTRIHYTLDGSPIDISSSANDQTHGYFDFTSTNVQEIAAGRVYAVTIDFDPSVAGVQTVSQNTLRPNGDPDHITLRYLIRSATDSSRLFRESYLIYPGLANDSFLKFSGMRDLRSFATATFISGGNTAGDVIFLGGQDLTALDSVSRYRTVFEHFEPIRPITNSSTLGTTRYQHRASLLADRETILVSGGFNLAGRLAPGVGAANESLALRGWERFSSDASDEGVVAASGNMDRARRLHSETRLYETPRLANDGRVLLVGGLNGQTELLGSVSGAPGTLVSSVQKPGTDTPTRVDVSFDTTATPLPAGVALVGNIVEIMNSTGTVVLEAGVITSGGPNRLNPDVYDLRVDGLISVVVSGTLFRVINTATSLAEDFMTDGNPGATVAASTLYARYGHTATLLQDGTVFVAGGLYNYSEDAASPSTWQYSSDIFDPATNTFESLNASGRLMSRTRFFHTATLLRDGKVLITGGVSRGDYVFRSTGFAGAEFDDTAEIFDPFSRTFRSLTDRMERTRIFHTATLLPSGKVLICGGYTGVTDLGSPVFDDSAELFDPSTGQFTETGSMLTPRGTCVATLIDKDDANIAGQVLVGGGANNFLAELYNESKAAFVPTAHCMAYDHYVGSQATELMDGKMLISGGQTWPLIQGDETKGVFLERAEVYDTSSVAFTETKAPMSAARRHHTATLLQDGTVLIAGGENDDGGLASCELYDPDEGTFSAVARMIQTRYKHTATLLPDGRVFLAGGASVIGPLQSCELYDPTTRTFSSAPSMSVGRFDHTATLLPNGWVLVAGGETIEDRSIEIFDPVTGLFRTSLAVSEMRNGRSGHTAVKPAYSIGRARFTSGSTSVVGSDGTEGLGLLDTSWSTSGAVRAGDLIYSQSQNVPYVISQVTDDHTLVLADHPDFSHDDSGYSGASTSELIGGGASTQVFEYYVIVSQDSYIAGGEVEHVQTEVFEFDPTTVPGEWPTDDPTDYRFSDAQDLLSGRFGHVLVSTSDLRLLIAGGRDRTNGELTSPGATPSDLTDDTWSASALDSRALDFPLGFRVVNGMIIVAHQHSAQAFLHD